MKILKRIIVCLMVIILLSGSCLFYAFKIEPYRLEVNQYQINDEKKDKIAIKIVQFSDVHIKKGFTEKNLHKVVTAINKNNPDIVVFTGDLYDNYAKYNNEYEVIEQLQKIKAKYAKIAIWGNRDYGGGAVRAYASIMEQSGFTLLRNEKMYVQLENNKKIGFMGLDDGLLGNIHVETLDNIENASYHVLLAHEPDLYEQLADKNYNLILSGHSHGGQIKVPFVKSVNKYILSKSSLATKYVEGMYNININKKLYVNTGIGTTHIEARFGVIPEVSVFNVNV